MSMNFFFDFYFIFLILQHANRQISYDLISTQLNKLKNSQNYIFFIIISMLKMVLSMDCTGKSTTTDNQSPNLKNKDTFILKTNFSVVLDFVKSESVMTLVLYQMTSKRKSRNVMHHILRVLKTREPSEL